MNDKIIYDGEWSHGKKHGKGELKYVLFTHNNPIHSLTPGNRIILPSDKMKIDHKYYYETYTGEFKADSFHGQGRYQFADGAVYEGAWESNLKKGAGKLTLPGTSHYIL